jgi:O-antigen ligase
MVDDDPLPRNYILIIAAVLAAGLFVVSTVIGWSSVDVFRGPKEIAFRTEAILLLVLFLFAATARGSSWRALPAGLSRTEVLLPLFIAGWTAVTMLVSTNRPLSVESFLTVVAAAVIFFATRRIAPHLPLLALDLCLAVAAINAVFVTVQEYFHWNPFTFPPDVLAHLHSTALVGNPNDVGSFLAAPAVAAIVAAAAIPGWRRLVYVAAAVVLTVGLIASGTRTAMIAVAFGVVVLAFIRPWKQAVITLLLLVIALGITFRPGTTAGHRARAAIIAAQQRRYDVLLSERLPAFLAAFDMLRSRPLWGVGPGVFKFGFMDARMELEKYYPVEWTRGWPTNFGETHNDHLQTAAETGLPGYALFLAAVAFVGIRGPRQYAVPADQPAARFARMLRPPLAATFFVLCLAQFPLQLAAPRLMFLTLAALSLAWDHRHA